jgi:hypothetical protein
MAAEHLRRVGKANGRASLTQKLDGKKKRKCPKGKTMNQNEKLHYRQGHYRSVTESSKFWKKTKIITAGEFVSLAAPHLIS